MTPQAPVGRVQIDPDEALLRLHDALKARGAPKPGSFTSLSRGERREYFRQSRRRSRDAERAAKEAGNLAPNAANIREALADAALMILATGGAGADQVRTVLAKAFHKRPGVAFSVEIKARRGKLRPKLTLSPAEPA